MSKIKIIGTFILFLNFGFIWSQYDLDTSECVFPFTYKGKKYTKCTTEERKYPWCSLTEKYQGVWKYCHDTTKTNWACKSKCSSQAYSTCKTAQNKKVYCLDKILDLSKKPTGSCSDEYKQISPFHTACLPPLINVKKRGVSHADKIHIVNLHNEWRRNVNVTAAQMHKMYWDDTLAMIAQKHADRCSFSHDDMNLRKVPGSDKMPGQNIVMVTNNQKYNWSHAFNVMYKGEAKRWIYGKGVKPEFAKQDKLALHYTQILVEDISKVGCGFAECVFPDRIETVFVCNFNNLQTYDQTIKPYKAGEPCSGCKNGKCDNNLCDCGGMECYGSKTLNLNTCKCEGPNKRDDDDGDNDGGNESKENMIKRDEDSDDNNADQDE